MKYLTVEQLRSVKSGTEAGLSIKDIASRSKIHTSTTERIRQAIRHNQFDGLVMKASARAQAAKSGTKKSASNGEQSSKPVMKSQERVRLYKEVQRLRNEGLSMKETASQLGITVNQVGYHLYKKKEDKGEKENGHINKLGREVCVGIAYSETERFISLLGERLGVSAKILRQRLSELLGHSSLR